MNSPMNIAAALSTSSSFAAARRDRHVRIQATGRGGLRLTRHLFKNASASL
jgi:hypothetical protein